MSTGTPPGWSSQDIGRYEAALEAINGAIGAYSALIAHEKAKPTPSEEMIAEAKSGRRACVKHRQELDPGDVAAVARTSSEYSALIEAIRRKRT